MFKEITVAAISLEPVKWDLAGNADELEKKFRAAAEKGAQLALGPEGVLEGYVVHEIGVGKTPPKRILEVAVTMNSSILKRFRKLARELRLCLAFGCAERIGEEVFNCAVFIDDAGKISGKYHKMQFGEGYHHAWWYNRLGKRNRAFNTPFGRCGFLICNDRWNPDLARIPVLDGAQYLLIPSYGSRKRKQDLAVLSRARENGVPIIEANVGVTLLVSKGEIVKLSRKRSAVTLGTIAIPVAPSREARDLQEKKFLTWRKREMPKRRRLKKAKRAKAQPS